MRFVCGFTSLLYLAATIGDYYVFAGGPEFYGMLGFRLLCFAVGWGNVVCSFSRRFIDLLPWTVAAYMLCVGCSEAVQVVLLHDAAPSLEAGEGQVLFTLLIVLTFYLFLPLRLLPTLVGAGGASLAYVAALAFFTATPPGSMITTLLFFLLVNGFGIYSLRTSNISSRREYRALREERLLNRRLRREMAERRKAQAQLQLLATTDDLTGLFNRRRFMALARQELARFSRYGHPAALLMLDVDHFKRVNDSHGHDTGDKVLQALATRLANNLRATDVCGRLGGEEFGVLLPGIELAGAMKVAEKLCAAVAQRPIRANGLELSVSVSLGVAATREGLSAPEELLHLADQALYRAKENGRNQACSVAELRGLEPVLPAGEELPEPPEGSAAPVSA